MWSAENRARCDRSRRRDPGDVTDEEWAQIEPLIPPASRLSLASGKHGPNAVSKKSLSKPAARTADWSEKAFSPDDQQRLIEIAKGELTSLHNGNFARYHIHSGLPGLAASRDAR